MNHTVPRPGSVLLLALSLVLVLIACRPAASVPGEFDVVWESWDLLKQSYIRGPELDAEVAVEGTATAMLESLEKPLVPYLTRISDVRGQPPRTVPRELRDIWRLWRLLQGEDPQLDSSTLAEAAVQGLVGTLERREALYLSPEDYAHFREQLAGTYEGIGAVVGVRAEDEAIIIQAIFPGGPSERVELQVGDRILEVNGGSVEGRFLEEVVEQVRGTSGSPLDLRIQRAGEAEPRDVRIIRDRVLVPSVDVALLPGAIGYIFIVQFQETTHNEVQDALERLLRSDALAVILDIRGNPGGSFAAARAVASQFLTRGLVMSEEDVAGQRTDWPAGDVPLAPDLPLAVLVNGGAAGAAEMVAASLQDRHRARIFGTATPGQGTVHTLQELGNGAAIYLATVFWRTPSGDSLDGIGLTPDVTVPLTEEDLLLNRDRQLEEAFRYLDSELPPFR
ncbi:MAG: S41 family peptidase [Dehalococcoidia bacterium]